MRKAIFVVGPESSGTRMMTQFFVQCGYEGDHGHSQPWDDMKFREYPDWLVFRRSMPHGGKWTDIVGIIQKLEMANYTVHPIFTWRDPRYMALSQVKAGHSGDTDTALDRIARAVVHIDTAFAEVAIRPVTITYEQFVGNESYRRAIHGLFSSRDFGSFGVHNANAKYDPVEPLNTEKLLVITEKTRKAKTLGL